jgi:hypothetical protein
VRAEGKERERERERERAEGREWGKPAGEQTFSFREQPSPRYFHRFGFDEKKLKKRVSRVAPSPMKMRRPRFIKEQWHSKPGNVLPLDAADRK